MILFRKQVNDGRQVYIVYPLISESGKDGLQKCGRRLPNGFGNVSRYKNQHGTRTDETCLKRTRNATL